MATVNHGWNLVQEADCLIILFPTLYVMGVTRFVRFFPE
jgi:hypothetical protein